MREIGRSLDITPVARCHIHPILQNTSEVLHTEWMLALQSVLLRAVLHIASYTMQNVHLELVQAYMHYPRDNTIYSVENFLKCSQLRKRKFQAPYTIKEYLNLCLLSKMLPMEDVVAE